MKLPPYPKYKPSGVEWLGNVPDHWKVKRVKWSVVGCINGVWGDEPTGADDVTCVRVADFDRDNFLVVNEPPTLRAIEPSQLETRQLRKGDLLIEKSGGGEKQLVGCVVLFDPDFKAVCSNFVARMPVVSELPPRFWCYVHAALYAGKLNYPAMKQTTGIQNLDSSAYLDTPAPFPHVAEQKAIAAFLDRETGRGDRLVAKKRELIERLKEKRTALISRTVTRGLPAEAATKASFPANPPLKPSGLDWLGDIPAHWKATKLRHYISVLSGFAFPSAGFSHDETDMRLLRGVNVGVSKIRWEDTVYWPRTPGDGLNEFELEAGTLVIGMDRPWITEGVRVAILSQADVPCLLLQRVAAIRPTNALSRDFVFRILSSPIFVNYFTPEMTGVSVPHISPEQIGDFPISVPPLSEQIAIAAYLDEETTKLDALVAKVEAAVERLQEYRTALITAAVTGRIDVRKVVTA